MTTMKIKVIYRDSSCLAAHKPSGIATYRESRDQGADGLKEILEEQLTQRLFPIHRIDADTSGVVLFALDSRAAAAFIRLFKEHKVKKIYTAWVVGLPNPPRGTIGYPLKKHKSTEMESARTDYEFIKTQRGFSLLKLKPTTGRFHQLRRHLDTFGHSIVGDPLYGNEEAWATFFKSEPRLMLQAEELEFIHPVSKKAMKIKTKEPL